MLLSLLRPLPSLLRIIFHVVFHSEAGLSVYQLFAVPNLVFPSTIKAFNNSVHTGQSQKKFAALGIFLGDFLSFSIALGSVRHISEPHGHFAVLRLLIITCSRGWTLRVSVPGLIAVAPCCWSQASEQFIHSHLLKLEFLVPFALQLSPWIVLAPSLLQNSARRLEASSLFA